MIDFLKDGKELAARRRMMKTGKKPKAIRARVLQIAQERNLPKEDVERTLRGNCALDYRGGRNLLDFAFAHGISMDWLIYGDIRGLARMKRHPEWFAPPAAV